MSLTLRRVVAALLALWSLTALLVEGRFGWALLVLAGAWLLWRRPTSAAPTPVAAPRGVPTAGRRTTRASTPDPMPYWILPTAAAAGAAAALHDREREVTTDSEEPAEEDDLCDDSYEAAGHSAPAAAEWDDLDDSEVDAGFGGFGGGGGWGDSTDFGGSGGGGDWSGGDDFGGFGGGGDWGDGGDW